MRKRIRNRMVNEINKKKVRTKKKGGEKKKKNAKTKIELWFVQINTILNRQIQ